MESCYPEKSVMKQRIEKNFALLDPSGGAAAAGSFNLKRARRSAEIEAIRRALHATGRNRTHAARLLEISHRALLYKLKEYGIRD